VYMFKIDVNLMGISIFSLKKMYLTLNLPFT